MVGMGHTKSAKTHPLPTLSLKERVFGGGRRLRYAILKFRRTCYDPFSTIC
jgi:hypothetical protein